MDGNEISGFLFYGSRATQTKLFCVTPIYSYMCTKRIHINQKTSNVLTGLANLSLDVNEQLLIPQP